MAFSDYLVERVKNRIPAAHQLEMKKMMGGIIFMVNGKMAIGVDIDKKSKHDRIMVRVGKEAQDQLMDRPGVREMDFTGRPMKGFMFVGPEGFDSEDDLDFWVETALKFNAEILKNGK